jgi:nucleotide-binding universal stress UspA family protein
LAPTTSILHPSDFSPASERAFAHALALALVNRARLTLLHAGYSGWGGGAPSVREMLERWGYLEEGSSRGAVHRELQVRVEKIEARDRHPVRATVGYLKRNRADLMVLSTGAPHRLPRWLRRPVAESLARGTRVPALFIPAGARGFIDPDGGRSSLRRILVPFAAQPDPRAAIDAAIVLLNVAATAQLEVTLLHFGAEAPPLALAARAGVVWATICEPAGDVVAGILASARSRESDLIVMPTSLRGRRFAPWRPSVAERVVRHAPCPVFTLPAQRR